MGPPSYMRSVVNWNVVMRRIRVLFLYPQCRCQCVVTAMFVSASRDECG